MIKILAILLLFLQPFRLISGPVTYAVFGKVKGYEIKADKDGTSPAELQRLITLLVKTTPQQLLHTGANRFIYLSSENIFPDKDKSTPFSTNYYDLYIRYSVLRI